MGRDVNENVQRPRSHQPEWFFPDEPDQKKNCQKNNQAVRVVIEHMDELRHRRRRWSPVAKIRPLEDAQQVGDKKNPERKQVRRHSKKESQPKTLPVFATEHAATPQSVRNYIHNKDIVAQKTARLASRPLSILSFAFSPESC